MLEKLLLLKETQLHVDDDRIFPMAYAPIVIEEKGKRLIPPCSVPLPSRGQARNDRQAVPPALQHPTRQHREVLARPVRQHHAVMLVRSLYENVEHDGKNVVLHFVPRPADIMLIACLYSEWTAPITRNSCHSPRSPMSRQRK